MFISMELDYEFRQRQLCCISCVSHCYYWINQSLIRVLSRRTPLLNKHNSRSQSFHEASWVGKFSTNLWAFSIPTVKTMDTGLSFLGPKFNCFPIFDNKTKIGANRRRLDSFKLIQQRDKTKVGVKYDRLITVCIRCELGDYSRPRGTHN